MTKRSATGSSVTGTWENALSSSVYPWSATARMSSGCESDKMVPTKNSTDLGRRLPDSELVTYPDAGHGGIFQYHAQFVQKALEFLGR